MRKLGTIFILFTLVSFQGRVTCLKCYRCGTLGPPSLIRNETEPLLGEHDPSIYELESCTEFEKPNTPRDPYIVECGGGGQTDPKDQICGKIVTYSTTVVEKGAEGEVLKPKLSTTRGCVYVFAANGFRHSLGCGLLHAPSAKSTSTQVTNIREQEHICYCDSNYCNSGVIEKLRYALIVLGFTLFHIL